MSSRTTVPVSEGSVTVIHADHKAQIGVGREVEFAGEDIGEVEWFVEFDNRDQVNHLIRGLRLVRDQAFGVDE
jgi:hypothetical protein